MTPGCCTQTRQMNKAGLHLLLGGPHSGSGGGCLGHLETQTFIEPLRLPKTTPSCSLRRGSFSLLPWLKALGMLSLTGT